MAFLVAGALLLWLQVQPSWSQWGLSGDDWAELAGWIAALLALDGIILTDAKIRPLRVAWANEAKAVNDWRFDGRPDLAAPDGVEEWTPQLAPAPAGGQPDRPYTPLVSDQDLLAPFPAEGLGGEG
jgi:hypothetical protein